MVEPEDFVLHVNDYSNDTRKWVSLRLGLGRFVRLRPALCVRPELGVLCVQTELSVLCVYPGRTTRPGHINFNTPMASGDSPPICTSFPRPKTSVRMSFVMATQPPDVL